MRRAKLLLALIAFFFLVLGGVVMAVPATRFLVLGVLRQENFHNDRPVSHWEYLLTDENPAIRREAAFNLGAMGSDSRKAAPALGRALKDPSEEVRINASLALSKMGDACEAALPDIAEALISDPSPQIRLNLALALIQLREKAAPAVDALIKSVDDEANREVILSFAASVRQRCIIALGRIGEPAKKAIPALVEALNDPHEGTRAEAAIALSKFGTDARIAVPHLQKLLNDEDERVRLSAEKALEAIGAKKGVND